MNQRKVGSQYEILAAEYLTENGMKVVETNFRNRQGEIDIIGYHKGYLVFTEVKYRKTQVAGHPVEAVTWAKQRKICMVADFYRYRHRISDQMPIRYDVIAILKDNIEWYQNAFYHQS